MRNNKKLLFLFVLAIFLIAGGMAEANTSDIDLPNITEGTEGKLEHDITAGVYSQILGPAWSSVWGENIVLGNLGQYSGLFLKICQSFNIAAMGIVVIIILGTSIAFTVNTARHGKDVAKSKIGPLGVIRLGVASTFTAPVFYGLSIMQYFLIICIGWSLVFAGNIWKAGAEYIVENIESPALDSAPPMVDSEALNGPVPLFYAVLTQEFLKNRQEEKESYPNPTVKEHDLITREEMKPDYGVSSEYDSMGYHFAPEERFELSIQGDWAIEHRPDEGLMILYPMVPVGMILGDLGSINIPAPVEPKSDATKEERTVYESRMKIAQERIRAFVAMGDGLRGFARNYMNEYSVGDGKDYETEDDALHLINAYRKQVTDAAIPLIKSLESNKSSLSTRLKRAFGIENGRAPSGGWIMSGIAPALTAIVNNQAEILHYGGGVKFTPPKYIVPTNTASGALASYAGQFRLPKLIAEEVMLFQNAFSHASQVLMRGRSWSGLDANGDPAGNFNRLITKAFYGGAWANNGIWDATIKTLGEKNPYAAVMDFGNRLLGIFAYMLVPSAAAGIVGSFPGLGAINDLVNNPAFIAVLIATMVAGLVFSVVTILFIKDLIIKALGAYFVAVAGTFLGSSMWLVAHAFPEGDGFIGQHARRGYIMVLEVLVRPALIVTGIILTIIISSAITKVILQLFTAFTSAYASFETFAAGTQLLWSIALITIVWSTLIFVARQLIVEFPNRVISFIGGVGTMTGVEQSNVSTVGNMSGTIGKIGAGLGGLGAGLNLKGFGAKGSSLNKDAKKDDAPASTSGGDIPQPMAAKTE